MDFDEKPITAVSKPLEYVKISCDCQPRVALLPTQSITKRVSTLIPSEESDSIPNTRYCSVISPRG